jgi:hypothetical protein
MSATPELDALLPRLRARAADPERRTTVRQTTLGAEIGALDMGGLLSMGQGLGAMLNEVVAANQAGRVHAPGSAMADDLQRRMQAPVERALPAPASEAAIQDAEREIRVALPVALRRVYAEVADGGFGPGAGLLSLAEVVARYGELRSPGMMPRARTWPAGLLPVVEVDPGWDCVDAATGAVVAWDPEGLTERSSEEQFRRSFSEAHPSVEAWLGAWVESRTQAEEHAAMMADLMSPASQVRQAQEARAAIGRMTPAERAAMGLPETGWEEVVWGGLGWDPDADPPSD